MRIEHVAAMLNGDGEEETDGVMECKTCTDVSAQTSSDAANVTTADTDADTSNTPDADADADADTKLPLCDPSSELLAAASAAATSRGLRVVSPRLCTALTGIMSAGAYTIASWMCMPQIQTQDSETMTRTMEWYMDQHTPWDA